MPGRVLASSTYSFSSEVTSKSTRVAPVAPTACTARSAKIQHALISGRRKPGGEVIFALPLLVLRLVVVEAALGLDLDRAERVAVEHTDRHLAPTDQALHQDPLVETRGIFTALRQLSKALGRAGANARSTASRFDEARETKRAVNLLEAGEVVPTHHVVRRRRHVVEAEELLALELVHRERARKNPGTGVGDAHGFEHALDAAVFAVGAVQGDDRHVDTVVWRSTRSMSASTNTFCTLYPRALSASNMASPVFREMSRSALTPPSSIPISLSFIRISSTRYLCEERANPLRLKNAAVGAGARVCSATAATPA